MTLTKGQRQYRQRKKRAEKDFRRVKNSDGTFSIEVNRKPLCVRVSREAAEKLKALSEQAGLTKRDMLSRMINLGIPNVQGVREMGTAGYPWPEKLIERPTDKKIRSKRGGTVQLNMDITSTAWKKLAVRRTQSRFSKARIVQDLINGWTPKTAEEKRRNREYRERIGKMAERFFEPRTPPTPEEMAKFHEDWDKMMQSREEQEERFWNEIREVAQRRHLTDD